MAVAKTYAKMETNGEPFKENGRMYINVIAPKGLKKVRWYSDAEYKRLYPEESTEDITTEFNARIAFGFGAEGYITLYKGKNVEEWAENDRTNIWYNLTFGYYTPGRLDTPHLIDGIEPIKLKWDEIVAKGNIMKSHDEVRQYVNKLLILDTNGTSEYQGTENEWLQKTVKVAKKSSKESHFGTKYTYTLEDSEGNLYVWETGARDYPTDASVSLKMKVKEHKEIGNTKVTVVWYCKET